MTRKVSVLIPVRDEEETLTEALQSVLAQEDVELDIVVVDHGSTDNTPGLLSEFVQQGLLRVLHVERELPFALALERGRALCQSAYIARFDADDVMHAARLKNDVSVLEQEAGLGACACQSVLFGEGVTTGMRMYVAWQNSVLSEEDFAKELWIEQPCAHPATTFRQSALDAVGGYRAGPFPEDYDLFLRLHLAGFGVRKRKAAHHFWRERPRRMTRDDSRYSRDAFFALKAQAMKEKFRLDERKVWVMGPGKEGARISRALESCGVSIDAFYDVNQRRVGGQRRGVRVLHQAEMKALFVKEPNAFAIGAVGTSGARGAVRTALEHAGFVEGKNALVVC